MTGYLLAKGLQMLHDLKNCLYRGILILVSSVANDDIRKPAEPPWKVARHQIVECNEVDFKLMYHWNVQRTILAYFLWSCPSSLLLCSTAMSVLVLFPRFISVPLKARQGDPWRPETIVTRGVAEVDTRNESALASASIDLKLWLTNSSVLYLLEQNLPVVPANRE